jgi:hypothetical protein
MANTRGVFTLQDVRYAQEDDIWVTPEQAFASDITSTPNVGYIAGGIPAPESSAVSKTDYSTDTTSALPSANLVETTNKIDGITSLSAGYFGGGETTPIVSSVNKITYNTETSSKSPGSSLSLARIGVGAAGNSSKGYFAGGYAPATYRTTADKFTYATETSSEMPSAALTAGRAYIAGVGNPSNGYFGGGFSPGPTTYSRVDKLAYSTDTTADVPGANLSVPRYALGGTGGDTAGYFSGGDVETTSRTDKLTYSNDTTAYTPGANLPAQIYSTGATGNVSAGYLSGGRISPNTITTTNKITFSTDTTATVPGAALPVERRYLGAVSPRQNDFPTTGYVASTQNLKGASSPGFGYWAGAPGTSNVHKHYFATDSVGESTTNLNNTTYAAAGISNGNNFYLGGGNTPSKSIIEKITYATDTCVQLSATITQNAGTLFAYGNKDKGYFAGGANGGTVYSSVARFDYSSETSARVPGGDLVPNPLSVSAGAGTPSFGVFGGGTISGGTRVSWFQKLQYSTETNGRIPSANLPTGTGNLTGTGTGYAGYRGGGETPSTISNISRHVYATDSVSYLTNSLPAGATTNFESIGSGKAAYWGIISNNMSKMDYSTETGYTVPVPSTSVPYSGAASAEEFDMPQPRPETPTLSTSDTPSSPNTGYFGGGQGPISIVDKLNYSTEIMARVPGANLSDEKMGCAATGNSTAGYFGGGFAPGPSHFTTVDKLTYSSDSTGRLPSTNLSVARHSAAATSSSTAGYFGGGNNPGLSPGTQTRVDKLTYSDDTIAAVPGASLETGVFYVAANGTPSAGYWGAGRNPSLTPINVTTMQKILYSTDTSTTIPSGALTAARYGHASTGNSDVGYFMGGYSIGWFPSNRMTSVIDKIAYSTETASFVPGGTTVPRGFLDGTGSSSAGYISGGNTPGPDTTRTEKLTFTTETSIDLPGAQITQAVWANAATSARANSVSATSNIL